MKIVARRNLRMREDAAGAGAYTDCVERARSGLAALCASAGIDDSHGVKHAEAVLAHADGAIAAANPPLSEAQGTLVRLAALLHDVTTTNTLARRAPLKWPTRVASCKTQARIRSHKLT